MKPTTLIFSSNATITVLALLLIWNTTAGAGDPNAEAIEKIPTPEEQLKNFTLAPGYKVNLLASEIDSPLYNPMGMAFDAEGRLWVIITNLSASVAWKESGGQVVVFRGYQWRWRR